MSNQKNPKWAARWKGATIIAAVTVFLDLSVLFLGTHSIKGLSLSIPWSVGSIGIITFVGILLHVNYLSNDTELSKREMRKAIAASLIAVYCTLVPLIIFALPTFTNDKQFELATTAIADFSWVIGAVIVFYFGSRSVDKWVDHKKEEQAQPGVTGGTVPGSEETQEPKENGREPKGVKPEKPSKTKDTLSVEEKVMVSEEIRKILKDLGISNAISNAITKKGKIKEVVELEKKAKGGEEETRELKNEEGAKAEESSSADSV